MKTRINPEPSGDKKQSISRNVKRLIIYDKSGKEVLNGINETIKSNVIDDLYKNIANKIMAICSQTKISGFIRLLSSVSESDLKSISAYDLLEKLKVAHEVENKRIATLLNKKGGKING